MAHRDEYPRRSAYMWRVARFLMNESRGRNPVDVKGFIDWNDRAQKRKLSMAIYALRTYYGLVLEAQGNGVYFVGQWPKLERSAGQPDRRISPPPNFPVRPRPRPMLYRQPPLRGTTLGDIYHYCLTHRNSGHIVNLYPLFERYRSSLIVCSRLPKLERYGLVVTKPIKGNKDGLYKVEVLRNRPLTDEELEARKAKMRTKKAGYKLFDEAGLYEGDRQFEQERGADEPTLEEKCKELGVTLEEYLEMKAELEADDDAHE